ncbi:unnamed protein product [Kuraishia capsulata CBS 1993]|uniref:General negative regulator of transcription subunit 1 n=1 Tax=Kuraishia capsulata CBS 1993 TaxID=1382522 RepID=W6MQU5_9ASCO|nr:uncharacterized protein KUCA_T00004712001 [Kuraishia capsulata CBS 1993]CDK28728.1 unnamed protein product [Kuraishia capsulata CBS 1993]
MTQLKISGLMEVLKLKNKTAMADFLTTQTGADLDTAMSTVLAEILVAGSQDVSSSTSVPSLPQATASGALLRSEFAKRDISPNWPTVLNQIATLLSDADLKGLTLSSLSEFLSAIPEEIVDPFLQSVLEMKTGLISKIGILLSELDPMQGAVDLLKFKLQPLFADDVNANSTILYFKNVSLIFAKSFLTSKDEHLRSMISQVPEYSILAAILLVTKEGTTTADLAILDELLVHLVASNSPYLPVILHRLETAPAQLQSHLTSIIAQFYLSHKVEDLLSVIAQIVAPHEKLAALFLSYFTDFADALPVEVELSHFGWTHLKDTVDSQLATDPESVTGSVLEFLDKQATLEYERAQQANELTEKRRSLDLKTAYYLLELLTNNQLAPGLIERFKHVQTLCLQAYPRLINFGHGHDEAILMNSATNSFSVQVEQEMKLYYQKMYNGGIEIKEVISMLQRLKVSDNPHDQDVFACMIHSLLDEYRFFPEYPIDALASTSVLFGSTIYFGLIEGTALSIALRFIMDSCRQPAESNMFKFAVQSLYAFRQRLYEYPKYCSLLFEIPALASQPQIYDIIRDVANGRITSAQKPSTSGEQKSETTEYHEAEVPVKSLYLSLVVDESIVGDVEQDPTPPRDTSDRVLFIVNNMTSKNLSSRVDELKSLLLKEYYEWFSVYLVRQRAKTEPNNHKLYAGLVDGINSALFDSHVIQITLQQIAALLNSSHSSDSELGSSEKTHLKNLGAWLGLVTLARNKPIRQKNLSLKLLLIEAYDLGKLDVIIPFVCKIIDQTKHSRVFRYPNPWTLGILQVLKELYVVADLKLMLKFEVEVLCNSLQVSPDKIEPSTLVRSHTPDDFRKTAAIQSLVDKMARANIEDDQELHQQIPGAAPIFNEASPSNEQARINSPFENLRGSTSLVTHPQWKRIFQAALTKSVREILPLVVERTNSIALVTTQSLILKDFAMEGDENKLRKAYVNMVSYLSESLTQASSHDPLRESVHLNFVQLAKNLVNDASAFGELPTAINDNLELASSIIQRAAVEKAIQDLDDMMLPAIAARRQHREARTEQPYFDQQSISRYSLQLPEPLGLKLGGVSSDQFLIYDKFGRNTAIATGAGSVPVSSNVQLQQSPQVGLASLKRAGFEGIQNLPAVQQQQPQPLDQQLDAQQSTIDQSFAYLQQLIEGLLKTINDNREMHLREVGPDHPLRAFVSDILQVCGRLSSRDNVLLQVAQFTVNALFTSCETQLACETLVFLLDKLCDLSPSTAKDVTWWLVHAEDERKFNTKVMSSLIIVGLVPINELDISLSSSILGRNQNAINFGCELVTDLVLGESPIALRSDFAFVIDAIGRVVKQGEANAMAVELLSKLNEIGFSSSSSLVKLIGVENPTLKDRMGYVFAEWVKLVEHGGDSNETGKLQVAFVAQLLKSDILIKSENLVMFITTCVEMAVVSFNRELDNYRKIVIDTYTSTDALAKLVVKIIVLQEDLDDSRAKSLNGILTIMLLAFAHDHETHKSSFNERPYFRLLSSLLSEWSVVRKEEPSAASFDSQFYSIFADILLTLQPSAFPGFTFAWMSLISHRLFLPEILSLPQKEAKAKFVSLLVALFEFQSTYVKGQNIPEAITVVYKGTLRIVLVIAHDFPELLAGHSYQLVSSLSPSYVQLRNLILSAFPRGLTVPDPFQPDLKMDRFQEVTVPPLYEGNPGEDLGPLRKSVDSCLRASSLSLIKTIVAGLKLVDPKEEAGIGYSTVSYNVKHINALVLYLGISAVEERRSTIFNQRAPQVTLLAGLIQEGNVELQFQILEAMANQLRYPNSHTHWFSCAILHFFGSQTLWGNQIGNIQQLITRVLLERTICNKPHPWGLVVTFTELLKNNEYSFFELPFWKSTVELERLFGSLMKYVKAPAAHIAEGAPQVYF